MASPERPTHDLLFVIPPHAYTSLVYKSHEYIASPSTMSIRPALACIMASREGASPDNNINTPCAHDSGKWQDFCGITDPPKSTCKAPLSLVSLQQQLQGEMLAHPNGSVATLFSAAMVSAGLDPVRESCVTLNPKP